MVIKYQFGVHA